MQRFTTKDNYIFKNVITYTREAFPSDSTHAIIPSRHALASSTVFLFKSQDPATSRPLGSNNNSTVEVINYLQ
jgi:hypothetical protein